MSETKHVDGQTLNAVTFQSIIGTLGMPTWVSGSMLALVLALEAGLLLVAANAGFLGGPAVMANIADDSWAPRQFLHLSSRLVTQNGILVMGVAALLILIWSQDDAAGGAIHINVFHLQLVATWFARTLVARTARCAHLEKEARTFHAGGFLLQAASC